MSVAVEHVTDAQVIDFDEAHARIVLRRIDDANSTWVRSGYELADLIFEAVQSSCWRVDDDFRAALASGAIAPEKDGRGYVDNDRTWLVWKFNRGARTARQLVDYGALRAIIAADPDLPQLAEPEYNVRPLGKLLRPRYLKSETPDTAERDEAIRQAWRDALSYAEGNPARAVKEMPKAIKRSEYRPLRRLASKSEGQKAADRQRKIEHDARTMAKAGHALLYVGAVDVFDAVISELMEARGR